MKPVTFRWLLCVLNVQTVTLLYIFFQLWLTDDRLKLSHNVQCPSVWIDSPEKITRAGPYLLGTVACDEVLHRDTFDTLQVFQAGPL